MQLSITAWLHRAVDHATRESKNVNKLVVRRQDHEDDFGYTLRIEKLHNNNIWIYAPRGDDKLNCLNQ